LFGPAERFYSHGGKRFRARLVELAFHAAGGVGSVPKKVPAALEMLHAGSLIIDDIEDGSEQRRGQPTLHRQIGVAAAINTANWMYFQALEKLSHLERTEYAGPALLPAAIRTVRSCHEGQALDISAHVSQLDPRELSPLARKISELKTGGLVALAAWMGACCSPSADASLRSAIRRFGFHLGVVVQMRNDLGELLRDPPRLDDLSNHRVTWPWAWLAETAPLKTTSALQRELHLARKDSELVEIA
jgi:geranylgeranyl pyrophosphate synthase